MSSTYTFFIGIVGIALLLAAGCIPVAAQEGEIPGTVVLNMTVPFGPIPVASTNGVNIAYELELTPPDDMTLNPEMVEVINKATGEVMYTENSTLLDSLYHPASVPPPTEDELQNGTGLVPEPRISVWFTVSPDAVPDTLTHRLTLNRTLEGLSPVTVTGGEVTVRKDLAPVIIGSPVKGPGWFIMETTSPLVHHFLSQITMNGVTRVPQRYAQDFLYLDPMTGKVFPGDETIAREYYGFGKELYAVADGTVVSTHDGMPDNELTTEKPPKSVITAGGNYVIIDIGENKYACYAHMVNGSVMVKPGDSVVEGQVIGLMGNSGNSDAPHLHFQVVTDTPLFLGAEGYPHVYRSFDVTGMFDETNLTATFFEEPYPQENRLMENDVIVSFP